MTALATSSTEPILYIGIQDEALFLKPEYSSSLIPVYLYKFVSIVEGLTALTLIPSGASSKAVHLVNISRPALVMQYPMVPALGLLPYELEMLMMQPLLSAKCG
jgi:hypothetical protein